MNSGAGQNTQEHLDSGTKAIITRMADLLPGLPPILAHLSGAKDARLRTPGLYQHQLTEFMATEWMFQLDPGACILGAPSLLGGALLEAVCEDLAGRGQATLIRLAEANRQIIVPGAKGRIRLSGALLEAAEIKQRVIFCARRWWVEVWASEVRNARLQFPALPQFAPGSPGLAHDLTT